MPYPTYHCSIAFRCSVCLISFLLTSLVLSGLLLFMLCAPSPFSAQFLFCTIQLLHTPPSSHLNYLYQQHSLQPPTTTTTPSFLCTMYFIASVHLLHEMFAIPLHAESASLSYTSRVLYLIIIVTLQLLWWFPPRLQHHCMLY
jgi:hypothetical protein